MESGMTKLPSSFAGKAAVAGAAIGSAAVAAAMLYASRRKDKKHAPHQLPPIPSGEPPETD
jgi:hypothetical protein